MRKILGLGVALFLSGVQLNAQSKEAQIQASVKEIEQKVIEWRRDIHQNPELGNREVRTAAFVAQQTRPQNLRATSYPGVFT